MSRSSPERRQVGDYRLLRRLGAGGMGEVFLAERQGTVGFTKRLALKLLRPESRSDVHRIDDFIAEARIAAQLSHPAIVAVYDFGRVDDAFYMVMEYVDGCDLYQLQQARTSRPLPPAAAAYIVSQLAEALAYIHRRQPPIIHRDVSPQNVFVTRDGHLKLGDFGICKAPELARAETQVGLVKGKPQYLAPEQLTGMPLTPRVDIYAAGLILYELLTGERFNRGKTGDEVILGVLEPRDVLPSRLVPEAAVLDDVVSGALARNPAMRTRDAALLGDQLRAFLQRRPFAASDLERLFAAHFAAQPEDERLPATIVEEVSPAPRSARSATAALRADQGELDLALRKTEEGDDPPSADLLKTQDLHPRGAPRRAVELAPAEPGATGPVPRTAKAALSRAEAPAGPPLVLEPEPKPPLVELARVSTLELLPQAPERVDDLVLRQVLATDPAEGPTAERESPAPRAPGRPGRLLWGLGVVAILLGGAGALWIGLRPDAAPPAGRLDAGHGPVVTSLDAGAEPAPHHRDLALPESGPAGDGASGHPDAASGASSGPRRPPRKPKTVRAPRPPSSPPGLNLASLRARIERAAVSARRKGLWPGDSAAFDGALSRARQAMTAAPVEELERQAAAFAIDQPFVQRKLRRVEARVRSLDEGRRKQALGDLQAALRLIIADRLVEASNALSALQNKLGSR